MINYGVIGTGHMGHYHVNVLSSMHDLNLAAVYDINTAKGDKIAAQYATRHAGSLEELLDKCDAVSLAVPTTSHYEVGKKILEAGRHLLIEKPVCARVSEAEELFALAEKNNLILEVGHVERFNGAVQELLNIVNRPLLWESRRMGPDNGRLRDVGVAMDLMIHDVDICLRVIRDKVVEIRGAGRRVSTEFDDIATAQLIFENGCVATLSVSRATQEKIRTLSISQEDSYLFLDFTTQDLQIHRQATSKISTSSDKIQYRQAALIERLFIHKENPLKSEIEHFINCIGKEKNSASTNRIDLETLKITTEVSDQIKKML